MMINKKLIGMVGESRRYIAANVAFQWCALGANLVLIGSICRLLERLYRETVLAEDLTLTAGVVLGAVAVRFGCAIGAARMSYLSSRAVKRRGSPRNESSRISAGLF